MWHHHNSVHLDSSEKQFEEAINVWISKPHTINRRLVGAKITSHFTGICNQKLQDDMLFGLLLKLKHEENLESCLEEFGCFSGIKQTNYDIIVMIRELVPKQLGRFHTARELIVKDLKHCRYIFLPIAHIDEKDRVVHQDNTMGYMITYIAENKQINIDVTRAVEESPCTSLGVSKEWLESVLVPKLINWSKVGNLNTEVSSLKLVPIEKYTLLYQHLKEKHGKKLVENWPEKTDPRKFVYEDVAIATYLILLWESDRLKKGLTEKQTFVDLGCGNGLLVHLLSLEGYQGFGLDIRKRNIWDMFGKDTDLREDSITPDKLFPESTWLIGNHSDELTPWIPVIAARSSYRCNFFVLPCCPWDFTCKFSAKQSGISQYRAYLNYVKDIVEVCGFVAEEDTLRIPSTKRVCFIGQSRTYDVKEWATKDEEINSFIKERNLSSTVGQVPNSNSKHRALNNEHDNSIVKNEHTNCSVPNLDVNVQRGYEYTQNSNISDSKTENTLKRKRDNEAVIDNQEEILDEKLKLKCETDCLKSDICKKTGLQTSFIHNDCCSITNTQSSSITPQVNNSGANQGFKPREYKDENKSHCLTLDVEIKLHIVKTVFDEVLSKSGEENVIDHNERWNKGGSLKLSDVAPLFNATTLQKLKNECGGLQTLLRNYHHVFLVQGGQVQLRDWTKSSQHDKHQLSKKKRKGQHLKCDPSLLWKTKLCYFNDNHPDGCPLETEECRFAHGEYELRSRTNSDVGSPSVYKNTCLTKNML